MVSSKKISALPWRRIGIISGATLTVLLVVILIALVYASTETGRGHIVQFANDSLASEENTIYISGIDGSLYSELNIPLVSLSDKDGIWLEVRGININWSAMALLGGKASVSNLTIETVDLVRAPADSEEQAASDEPFSIPSFPVDIEVSNFSIAKINISEALADLASEFKINGAFKLTEDDGIVAQTNLVSTGDYSDEVKIDVSYPSDASNLKADININAPKDGLFISLAGIDPKMDITATFKGEGPIDNWSGSLNAKIADENIIEGLITHVNDELSLHADFDVRKFIPSEFSSLVGQTNTIDVNYRQSELTASLISKLARLDAKGTETIEFSLGIIDPEPINQLISPAYIKATKIDGNLSQLASVPEITLTFNNLVAGVRESVEATITGQMDGTMKEQIVGLTSSGSVENITGEAVEAVKALLPSGIAWNLKAKMDQATSTVRLDALSLTNDFIQINSAGEFNSDSGAFDADLNTVIASISNIAKSLGLDKNLSGEALSITKLTRANNEAPIDAKLNLNTENIDLGDPTLNELIGPAPTFTSHITLSSDGAIHVTEALFKAAILSLDAQVDISATQVIKDAGFNLSLSNIENMKSLDGTALSGNIDVVGSLTGDLKSPSVVIETGFKALNIQSFELQDFVAQLRADNILDEPKGALSITSATNFGALDVATSFNAVENNYIISAIYISLGVYQATGAFELPAGKPAAGTLKIITREIDQNEVGISGSIAADIALSEENNAQKIIVESTLNNIIFPISENELLTLSSANISTIAVLKENAPKITLNASLVELMHPSFQSQSLDVYMEQITDSLNYKITAQGTDTMPYELRMSGDVINAEDDGQNITLSLEGMIGGTPIGFDQRAEISLLSDGFDVAPFALRLGEGHINGNINAQANEIHASLSMDKADLKPVLVFATDLPLTGLLSGKLDLNSTGTTLASTFDVILSDIVVKNQSIFAENSLKITAKGTVDEARTELAGTIGLNEYFEANYSGALPLKIDPTTFAASFPDDQPINGKLTWNGDITPTWPILQLVGHDLTGDLDADFTITGTLSTPDLDGTVKLTDGRYENMQTGFVVGNMQMAATIVDRHFTLDSFSANDGEEGMINATADIIIDSGLSYTAQADLILASAHLVRLPELDITASSNLKFEKTNNNSSLSGDITVENASIGTIEQAGPVIAKLDVTEINGESVAVLNEQQAEAIGPIDLDLKLRVPNKLFIVSYGLDSEWQADLSITGTSEEPIIDGTANLVRGFFEFSGKRFDLKSGNFYFPNNKTNDPIIEIAAEHQLIDMTANLRIFGQASKPTLEMSATPYLPENEVLARILFGTSVVQLTAVEAVQLASAVHSLSNGGGQGWMGGIRRAIGVDRLSIDNDRSREYGTTITGGKYLTDNVYVEVSTAPGTGRTATSVEVGISRNLSLVTRRTLAQDNNLSIKWFWDY